MDEEDVKGSVVVMGEASESDDEDFMRPTGKQMESINLNDGFHSSEDELNITVSAFVSKAEEMSGGRYKTLLHKKLKESNFKLREDMKHFVKSSLKFTSDQLSEINQSLLAAQIETQNSVALRRRSGAALSKINANLASIVSYKIC